MSGVKVYYVGIKNLYWPFGDKENPVALKPFWHAVDSYNYRMARIIGRILDVERPDLVHTNILAGFSALVWQPVKRRRLPLVHTLRDYYLMCPRGSMFRGEKNCVRQCVECHLYALARRYLSERVDVVVGLSNFILRRHLELGYFANTPKKKVIYNACQAEAIELPSNPRSLPVRFGYLGQLRVNKGLEVLLESVRQLPKGSWTLDIAGRGFAEYERRLQAKYRMLPIKFLGYVRPEALFSKIDVLVVPSLWHEPFGRVLIEAYAHGVPVIGSNRGGIPEIVEEGRTGCLFEPDLPGDLAAKMRWYIRDPAKISHMQATCLKKSKSFLPQDITQQYLEVYLGAVKDV